MQDHAPLLERAFTLDVSEESYRIEEIDGEVPDFVRGTFYANGPARFTCGEVRYRHWLDGDGMVCALRFDDAGVHCTNRFVRSTKFVDEEKAGRALYRTFGTSFASDQLFHHLGIASPVNVSAWYFGGKLLAFGEQGLPWELDPVTLETRGEYTFGGRLNPITPFAAHPSFDPESGEMFNFGISFSQRHPSLNLFRFDRNAEIRNRRRIPIPYPCSVHDFSLSPSYTIVHLHPHLLDMEGLMSGGKTIMEALSWEPERGSRLLIAARESGEQVASVPVGSGYCLHHINTFEEDGRLVVDFVELEEPTYPDYEVIPDLFTDAGPGWPVRYVIDTASWEVVEKREIDYRFAPDLPTIDPRRATHRSDDHWILGISKTGQPGRKFFDQLAHLSFSESGKADIWQAPEKHYLASEPDFIPEPGNGSAGLVICKIFDAERVHDAYLLFNAYDVAAGPIATLNMKAPVPPRLHGAFYPAGS